MERIYFKLFLSLVYLILGYLITYILKRLSRILIFGIKKSQNKNLLKKTYTLKTFINSLIYVFTSFFILFFILEIWGVNIIPLITGAGILGLSLSFGAQTLIKDLISGFFIILENQFNIGDKIKIGNYQGTVKKITLRQTILEDEKGNTIFIPNSQINGLIKIKK